MGIDAMRVEIKTRFGLDIYNRRLWRTRAMAKEEIEGTHAELFKILRCYASMVLVTNPNSVAIVNTELLPSPITGNLEDRNTPPPRFKGFSYASMGLEMDFFKVVGRSLV